MSHDAPVHLSWDQVLAWRMKRQWLSAATTGDATAVVRRLAGVQAQVPSCAATAVALRQQRPQPGEVERQLSERSLMRTWAMRGTLHLLAADEAGAFLSLVGEARSWERASWQRAFVTAAEVNRLADVVAELLEGTVLTRAELVAGVMQRTGDQALGQHLQSGWAAVLKPLAWRGVLCNGPTIAGRVTFSRPDTWLPGWSGLPSPDEAAPVVISSYLGAHGPASTTAFDQWLTRGASKKASIGSWFADLGDRITTVDVEGQQLSARREDLDDLGAAQGDATVRLLPAFDQYILGPGTGDAHVIAAERREAVSKAAGWISPVVVSRGKVVGTWQVSDHRIDISLFREAGDISRAALDHEIEVMAALSADHYAVSITTI